MTTKQMRRHIRKIRFHNCMVVILALVACACILGSFLLTESCYNTWIDPTSENKSDQVTSIQRAIWLHPNRIEGYNKILDIYLADGILTAEENSHYRQLLQEQQERLNKMPEEAAALYRRLSFAYISCYDADTETRLKIAYSYFMLTQPYFNATEVEVTAIDTYMELGRYFSEYVWTTGDLREPEAGDIKDLSRRLSAMMDVYQDCPDQDRLAYACCLAMLLDQQGELWASKAGEKTVTELAGKIEDQIMDAVTLPVTIHLQAELIQWKNEHHSWEE